MRTTRSRSYGAAMARLASSIVTAAKTALVLSLVALVGVGCGGSQSQPRPHRGRLPAAGAIVYAVYSDSVMGLGGYEEGRLRSGSVGSDVGLTETDHRAVAAASSDGRLMVVQDFHAKAGGLFARWSDPHGTIGVQELRSNPAGPFAVCGSRAVAHVVDDHLMLWQAGAGSGHRLATALPAAYVTCSSDGRRIAALGADGTLMLGTPSGRLETAGGLRLSAVEWAPGGGSLAACTLPGDEPSALVLVARDGSLRRRLADAGKRCEIAWSPDRRHIAFVSDDGLRVACVCGGAAVRVARDGFGPVWSPDGAAIAYERVVFGLYAVAYPSGRAVLISDELNARPVAWLDARAAGRVASLSDPYPCC